MDESDGAKKKGMDESIPTNEKPKVTDESLNDKGASGVDERNAGKTLGEGSEKSVLKRPLQDVKHEEDKSFSSLDDNERDDGNAGILSTDTSAMAHGVSSSDVGDNEVMKLEERRAYNRRNAARSRQRVKDQLRDLQQQVIAHTTTRSELERTNVRLLAENNVLRDEVHKLRTILSGAPLFGQQSQTLQPFLQQQMSLALNPTVPYATQPTTAKQIPPTTQSAQVSFSNTIPQQQSNQTQLGFFPSPSTQTNQQQFAVGDDNSQQNAIVQLLLQQIMNNNNISSTQISNSSTNEQQQIAVQQHQSQLQSQPQPHHDNPLASFMSFVSGGGNAMIPSNEEAAVDRSQQQLLASTGPTLTEAQSTAATIFQNSYPVVHPQQFDQLNFQELQQSFRMQQQQLHYDQKHDLDDKTNESSSKKYRGADDNVDRYEDTTGV
jgi:hypothetical protein